MSETVKTCGEISCDECNDRYEEALNKIDRLTAAIAKSQSELAEVREDVTQHKTIVEVLDKAGVTKVSTQAGIPIKTLGRVCELLAHAKQAEKERDELKQYADQCDRQLQMYSETFKALGEAQVERDRYREALERIANPYEHKWYKSANDGDDVVDSMIAIAREALKDATTLEE